MKVSVLCRWQWWRCLSSADDSDEGVCPLQMTGVERSTFDWRRRLCTRQLVHVDSQQDSISWHTQRARYWFLRRITLVLFSTSCDPAKWERDILNVIVHAQGVTKKCRLSLLTNSALVIRVQMRGEGESCGVSANEKSCAHHVTWSSNKLWRSTSIFNLQYVHAPLSSHLLSLILLPHPIFQSSGLAIC